MAFGMATHLRQESARADTSFDVELGVGVDGGGGGPGDRGGRGSFDPDGVAADRDVTATDHGGRAWRRGEELRRRSRQEIAKGAPTSQLRKTDEGRIKDIVERLQLSKLLEDPKIVDKLAQAGYRGPRPVSTFYFARLIGPFLLAGIAAFYLYGLHVLKVAPTTKIGMMGGALALGFYGPNLYVSNRASKRRESIVGAFPDALDLLLICVEAGMSVEAALQEGRQRDRHPLHRAGGGAVAPHRRAVLPAGASPGL